MAAGHTVMQTVIYTRHSYTKIKPKQHRNNMTKFTSPQIWQINSKSVL